MLGDGQRMHGYLGYYHKSPPDSWQRDALDDFMLKSFDAPSSLPADWAYAHHIIRRGRNSNWATIYHANNYYDTFNSFTSNTTNGSAYTIYLISRKEELTLPLTSSSSSGSNSSIETGYDRYRVY